MQYVPFRTLKQAVPHRQTACFTRQDGTSRNTLKARALRKGTRTVRLFYKSGGFTKFPMPNNNMVAARRATLIERQSGHHTFCKKIINTMALQFIGNKQMFKINRYNKPC